MKFLKYLGLTLGALLTLFYAGSYSILKYSELSAPKNKTLEKAIFKETTEPQKITLLDDGVASFYARLKLVREAQKSIDLEFFIYNLDASSRLFSNALIEKAKQGVKIRLLVDFSFPVFKLWPAYAEMLQKAGIEIRYYNAPSFFQFVLFQHRNHRKVLSIDGRAAISGGRNIADEYFEISPKYNFWDSDFLIEGSLVSTIDESFNLYWNSSFAEKPDKEKAEDFLKETEEDKIILEYVNTEGKKRFETSPSDTCTDNLYVTDMPGLEEKNRRVYQVIVEEAAKAKKQIWVESPYFVLREQGAGDFKKLADNNIELNVLTNNLFSTDAFYTVAALHSQLGMIAKIKMTLKAYNGSPRKGPRAPFKVSERWGLHGKRAVIDEKTILVGTYNIDPRSANLNSEMIYICRSSEFLATSALKDIQAQWQEAGTVVVNNEINSKPLFANSTLLQKIEFVISWPLATLFDFLL